MSVRLYYGYWPFATEPLTLLQTSMNKARETHTFPCLLEAFQVAWRSRLPSSALLRPGGCVVAELGIASGIWAAEVAAETWQDIHTFFCISSHFLMLIWCLSIAFYSHQQPLFVFNCLHTVHTCTHYMTWHYIALHCITLYTLHYTHTYIYTLCMHMTLMWICFDWHWNIDMGKMPIWRSLRPLLHAQSGCFAVYSCGCRPTMYADVRHQMHWGIEPNFNGSTLW